MANPVCEVLLTREPLPAAKEIFDLATGAVIDFWGVVRGLEGDNEIDGIEYEAHWTMAEYQLEKIARQAASDFTLNLVVIHHRIGFVPVGESSLLVRTAGQHRAETFAAGQWIADELKQRVPIWKHPRFKIDNRSEKKAGVAAEKASIPLRS